MVDTNFLAGQASVWTQPNGPNTQPQYLGCHGVGDVEEPKGDVTLLFCPDPANSGKFTVKNSFQEAPESVTATLETDIRKTADYLETIKFAVPIFIHKVVTGRRDDFSNFDRSYILRTAKITNITTSNLATRNPDDEGESTQAFEFAALEMLRIFNLQVNRVTLSESQEITNIAIGGEDREESAVAARQQFGDIIVLTTKAGAGVAANVLLTTTGGTPAATAADPFAVDIDIQGAAVFKVGRATTRILVGYGETAAGAPAKIAYSDNDGAAWTAVSLPTANAEFIQHGKSVFALDARGIWAGTNSGNIYISTDGGVTWTKQTASPLAASPVVAIHFFDSLYGFALLASGAAFKTVDGGVTWGSTGTTGLSTGTDIHMLTRYLVFAVGVEGKFYTINGGTSWAQRDAVATGAVDFKNELEGLAVGSATSGLVYHTIDGGYTWNPLALNANSGMTDAQYVDSRAAYVSGPVNASTGYFAKLTPVA